MTLSIVYPQAPCVFNNYCINPDESDCGAKTLESDLQTSRFRVLYYACLRLPCFSILGGEAVVSKCYFRILFINYELEIALGYRFNGYIKSMFPLDDTDH